MKKFLTVMFAFAMAILPLSLVGCKKKGIDIQTTMPENYKIVTSVVYQSSNTNYNTTYTYIRGRYNNHAVIYWREEVTGDYNYTHNCVWLAKSESTSVFDIDRGAIDENSNSRLFGDYSPNDYTLSNWWWYITATAFYPDEDLISKNDEQLVYEYYRGDIITISNDEYHYTKRREQSYTDGGSKVWTNDFVAGNLASEIPNIAEYYAQLGE